MQTHTTQQVSQALRNQPSWRDKGLKDFRDTYYVAESAPPVIAGSNSQEAAIEVMRMALGLTKGGNISVKTPIGSVLIQDASLAHTVEKRSDQRERFASFVIPTLQRPTEIWNVKYDDGSTRNRYIKLFSASRYDILVMVKINPDGGVFWNFMQRDRKGMNTLRIGDLVYRER